MEIYRASAFSKDGAGGNKAGVVLDPAAFTSAQKQEIAKEVGYSETVFFSESKTADYRLEYFTPTDEVPLCGHATVAAFVVLNTLNRLAKRDCTIETGAGILRIQIQADGMVLMEQNRPTYAEILEPSELSGCFDERAFAPGLPIRIVSTGLRDILLPIRSEAALAGLKPDFEAMKRLSKEKNVVGVHAFTLAEGGGISRRFTGSTRNPRRGLQAARLPVTCSVTAKESPVMFLSRGGSLARLRGSRCSLKLTARGSKRSLSEAMGIYCKTVYADSEKGGTKMAFRLDHVVL